MWRTHSCVPCRDSSRHLVCGAQECVRHESRGGLSRHVVSWSNALPRVSHSADPLRPAVFSGSFLRNAMAHDRALPRRAHSFRGRRAHAAERVLHRRQRRRRLEDRPTSATRGILSSTISRPGRSARSRSRRPIPTLSMSAAARGCSGRIFRPATACTNRPTPARRGSIWDCATGSRFLRSRSIRTIRIGFSRLCSAIPTGRMPSAACSAQPTAGHVEQGPI